MRRSAAVLQPTMLQGYIRLIVATYLGMIAPLAFAAEGDLPVIRVNAGRDVAPVPRRLFGVNLRQDMQQDAPIRQFLTDFGITLFRYPDSIDNGYTWDWEAGGVMSQDGKPLISPLARFGTAIDVARSVKGELFFTVKIHNSSPQEAARWVAEAKKRGMGGSYWCFGNEPYFKASKFYVTKETYVDLVNAFSPAMKAADPDIRLGIGWCGPFIEEETEKGRESFILRNTKHWVDFIDYHYYTGRWDRDKGMDARRIMAGSLMVAQNTRKFREIIQREAPEKADRIEIQFWEWSGPPWPAIGGMQTLATALFAADALGEMARCGVRAAMVYNLQERHCGLIPGFERDGSHPWPTEPWNGRTIRPIAYAIQMWSRYMGSTLVESAVTGVGSYRTKDGHTAVNFQGEVPLLAAHATRSDDRKSLQLLVANRDEASAIDARIGLQGFAPQSQAQVLTLNGPNALSNNDVTDGQLSYHSLSDAPEGPVKLVKSSCTIDAADFHYSFPPHSVTVIVMQSR